MWTNTCSLTPGRYWSLTKEPLWEVPGLAPGCAFYGCCGRSVSDRVLAFVATGRGTGASVWPVFWSSFPVLQARETGKRDCSLLPGCILQIKDENKPRHDARRKARPSCQNVVWTL